MDQNQIGSFGWLLAPTGGGNSILFCNPEQQSVTTVTTVPAPVVMTVDGSSKVNKVLENSAEHQLVPHQFQCVSNGGGIGTGPIKFEVIPKSNNNHVGAVAVSIPHLPSLTGASIEVQKSNNNGVVNKNGNANGGNAGVTEKIKSVNKSILSEDELARRREINRLREKRRREQMTPKERAKARKKNRLRARKRRKNMTPEEREQEKERNRERARQRRAQKLLQQNQNNQKNIC